MKERLRSFVKKRRFFLNMALSLYKFFDGLKRCGRHFKGLFRYYKDRAVYKKLNTPKSFCLNRLYDKKVLQDWYDNAGSVGNYFWQDFWAARLIYENKPTVHYDIGSRIDGFIGHLASFRENIVLIDIRPLDSTIPGVNFFQDDATNLNNVEDSSIESISALCSLEHFGLGRYGDSIDPEACFKAMKSIVRVLKEGGHAYISVPIGWEHVEFNAHRIFFADSIVKAFEPLKLVEFSVSTAHGIERDVVLNHYDDDKNNMGGIFGLFHFVK